MEKLIALKSSPHMNIVDNPVGDVGGVVQGEVVDGGRGGGGTLFDVR